MSEYVPLDARGWRLSMGLRPLEESRWLEVDERRDEELAEKSRLLDGAFDEVVVTRPGGDAPSAELLDLVRDWLARHQPTLTRVVGDSEHPIVAASRLVQEDLCVLVRTDAWRLEAACVCFPSRWSLASKRGATLDQIHGPVPGYAESLAAPTNAVFDRLKPDRPFWRLNWTLLDSPELFQPVLAQRAEPTPASAWYFRVERQTGRRLAATDAVVFTIHTYVSSLGEMIARHDDFADNLLRALDGAPEEMRAYKGWTGVADALRASL